MKFTWQYSTKTEIRRVIFTAEKIKNLFYQENGFLVLPYAIEMNSRSVFLPDLQLFRTSEFWDKVPQTRQKVIDSAFQTDIPEDIKENILKNIKHLFLTDKEISTLKSKFSTVEKEFEKCLQSLINVNGIEVVIVPTKFGSVSSYFPHPGKNKLIVYVRADQDISHLAEVIITALFFMNIKERSPQIWEQTERTTDFLLEHTKLSQLFPNYTPTTEILEKGYNDIKVIQDSHRFLQKLGYEIKIPLEIRSERIMINKKAVKQTDFSASEDSILRVLIQNKGKVVSFETLADVIWGQKAKEKYSLWAMAKKIQRIREKIRNFGINYDVILTFRKKGYMIRS